MNPPTQATVGSDNHCRHNTSNRGATLTEGATGRLSGYLIMLHCCTVGLLWETCSNLLQDQLYPLISEKNLYINAAKNKWRIWPMSRKFSFCVYSNDIV